MVIRAGFGIFFARQFSLDAPYATVGYNQTTTHIASTDKTSPRPVMLSKLRGVRSLVRTAAIRRSVLQADICLVQTPDTLVNMHDAEHAVEPMEGHYDGLERTDVREAPVDAPYRTCY